jgi:ABC-2 type transport system ATP-binding protein
VSDGVVLDGLVKTWRGPSGPIRAVDGIDVGIERGETVALLGPNGAGKSTTIDLLLGLARPDAGAVTVFGRPPTAAVDDGLVGAMLQTGQLIRDLSVRELVAMFASLYPQPLPVDEAIELAGLEPLADQRTQKLSGGETQRTRFALALVTDPELRVLDEPTVAMDVESRHAFWSAMRELSSRGKTILFATHYLDEADTNADRIVVMAHGRVVVDGPPTAVKARVGTRRIRATLHGAAEAERTALPGVNGVALHGDAVTLVCADSDAALRALLERYPAARDLEVAGAGLEEAFLELTREQ